MKQINHCDINKNFLTIGIPTYNRANKLVRLLNSIDSLCHPWLDKEIIRILISDNCSSDNTKDVVKNYPLAKYIDYSINEKNIGANGNIKKLISIFWTNYLIIVGDDDLIISNNIVEMIQILWLSKPDYGLVNMIDTTGMNTMRCFANDFTDDDEKVMTVMRNNFTRIGHFGSVLIGNTTKEYLQKLSVPTEKSMFPIIELFFVLQGSFQGKVIMPPAIKIKSDATNWEAEEWLRVGCIELLNFLKLLNQQNFLNEDDYNFLAQQIMEKRAVPNAVYSFLIGHYPQQTQDLTKYLLTHYPEKVKGIHKIMLLSVIKIPVVFNKIIRPIIISLYYVFYRVLYIYIGNLFRTQKRRDPFYSFVRKNRKKVTWL
jgi:glycosyltransferase involved in cell wall biosynthesis